MHTFGRLRSVRFACSTACAHLRPPLFDRPSSTAPLRPFLINFSTVNLQFQCCNMQSFNLRCQLEHWSLLARSSTSKHIHSCLQNVPHVPKKRLFEHVHSERNASKEFWNQYQS